MALSALDLFSIGIGPSSSHTVGPMRAALAFAEKLRAEGRLPQVRRVTIDLYGSLGATGRGHGSDKAVVLGLEGERPETVDTSAVEERFEAVREHGRIALVGTSGIAFSIEDDLILHRRRALPAHPNGMTFSAFDEGGEVVARATSYSIGGGFVVDEHALLAPPADDTAAPPLAFTTGDRLLALCRETGLGISDVMLRNETTWRSEVELRAGLAAIWATMRECVANGCRSTETVLPGPLNVPRRAPGLHARLTAAGARADSAAALDWLSLYALAVNEENSAGGRVVTAPTNGAAGIIPAVLHYLTEVLGHDDEDTVVRFLLTAAAIGIIVKENASISGAEVGCQGEVGSACAMAAAALCEALGGTPAQVENAAEIGIEHNLGLTCDPVGGLVQIPCIERNAVAANKAVTAARIALHGDGVHIVSLDNAVETMRATGADMKSKYKETSRGGLAVTIVAC